MSKITAGQKFNMFTAICDVGRNKHGHPMWKCICECGNVRICSVQGIQSGKHKSCGCNRMKNMSASIRTHGLSSSPEYYVWVAMKNRCLNHRCSAFKNYGGRGVSVCERWLRFEEFYEDMGARPSNLYSLERIDNNKGYSKENCKWAQEHIQARNKRTNVWYEYNGIKHIQMDWATILRIDQAQISRLLKSGTPFEEVAAFYIKKHNILL